MIRFAPSAARRASPPLSTIIAICPITASLNTTLFTQAHYLHPWWGPVLGEGGSVLLLDS